MDTSKKGNLTQFDSSQSFVSEILSLVNSELIQPMKIVTDTSDGMAGPILQQTYAHLPQIELIHINQEPDGISPTHMGSASARKSSPVTTESHR